jgi:hypothetical protein
MQEVSCQEKWFANAKTALGVVLCVLVGSSAKEEYCTAVVTVCSIV